MSASAILIVFCAIALISLIAVSVANQRQRRTKQIRLRMNQLRQRVDELEELVITLEQMVESRAIPKLVNDEVINKLQAMIQLDPGATYLHASLDNAEKRLIELSDESGEHNPYRLKESDAQIARAQHVLAEAARVLRHQHAGGRLTLAELDTFLNELSWTHLQIDVVSHTAQGHKALNRGDPATAHAFYKRAQHSVIHSTHPDPRRHRMIKELSEILNGHRKAISLDLMPETDYNPGVKESDQA